MIKKKYFSIASGKVCEDVNLEEIRFLTTQLSFFRGLPENHMKSIAVVALSDPYRAQQQRNQLMLSVLRKIGLSGMLENRIVFCTPKELENIHRDAVFVSFTDDEIALKTEEDLGARAVLNCANEALYLFYSFNPELLSPEDARNIFFTD